MERMSLSPRSSIISSALPPPRATQVSGSSATMTGKPVSFDKRRSSSRNKEPPPVKTRPLSAMSAASSVLAVVLTPISLGAGLWGAARTATTRVCMGIGGRGGGVGVAGAAGGGGTVRNRPTLDRIAHLVTGFGAGRRQEPSDQRQADGDVPGSRFDRCFEHHCSPKFTSSLAANQRCPS